MFLAVKEVMRNVYSVGAQDYTRKLFDELIELPQGTSYNSFLIFGSEKTALIDTVDPTKVSIILQHLIDVGVKKIDYIISNHAEQDHSGSIPILLERYQGAKVVTNNLCKKMLQDELFLKDEDFIVIKDGETLSLGDKTLQFVFTPWVHWPETMCTYLQEEKLLFTCDFFGSHLATENIFVQDNTSITAPMKRYYAEIMMPFAGIIKKNIEKVKSINPRIIAPSHGPIHKDSKYPIKQYEEWVDEQVKQDIVVAYISMHGSTKRIADYVADRILNQGLPVKQFNLTETPIGEFAMSLVEASTLIICSPTFLGKVHPNVAMPLYVANLLKPKTKILAYIGSNEWGGEIKKDYYNLTANFSKAKKFDPFMIKGAPTKNDFEEIDKYLDTLFVDYELLASHFSKPEIKQHRASIQYIHQETPDTKTYVLTKPAGFNYHAGQYVMFGFEDKRKLNGKLNVPITIASSPHENVVRLTIKKNTNYTTALLDELKIGDDVLITGPMGENFMFSEFPSRKIVMISGGSGITPFISLLRYASMKRLPYEFTVLNGNKTYEDIIYREELDYLSRTNANVFIMNVLNHANELWQGERGCIGEDLIKKYVDFSQDNTYLLCGPPRMVACIENLLKKLGVREDRILKEGWEINTVNDGSGVENGDNGYCCVN